MPGYYSYDVAPYLREIADCFSIDSQIREIDVMKGAQIGATVGVLENIIGYVIDHVKSAPVMLLTADAELAKIRVDSYITPMLQHSGLDHLIRSRPLQEMQWNAVFSLSVE
jgi:phage terminase large subunit GpA-like protein